MSDIRVFSVTIDEIKHHPNADRLDLAVIGGYTTVVGRDEFKPGDVVAFFPPDVLIPERIAVQLGVAKYLKSAVYPGDSGKSNCRVAATRLRGVPSFGFVFRVKEPAGVDLTERFHAVKYEPPEPLWYALTGDVRASDPRFHVYTDIENYRNSRYKGAFETGLPVRITEKVHGCLKFRSRITMADGTQRKIGQIKTGDIVLGVEDGNVVPTEVLQVFNNGPADSWLKIKTQRRGSGRNGNSYSLIKCTPNHGFWNPDTQGYRPASQLKIGDSVSLLRSDRNLTPIQFDILLGKILEITEEKTPRANRYDIETKTHNYFAHGVLVHNSNSRIALLGGEFHCGSHRTNKKETVTGGKKSVYWSPLTEEMKALLKSFGADVIVFGEVFGSKIQFMDYGVEGYSGYRVFDISVNGQYLNWCDVEAVCNRFNIPTVPLLYLGPFYPELVEKLVDGPTTFVEPSQIKSSFKGREGIVITPLFETHSDIMGGRLIAKAVSCDYLEKRKSDSH